jgi:hypothetical protein
MLQAKTLGMVGLLGLLASAAMSTPASADQRAYYRGGHYGSEPQVRLGVDVVWGGYGGGYGGGYRSVPPRPPVVWYPAYYAPDRYYDPHYNRGHGRGHHKHGRHRHHEERCDD